MGRSSDEIPVPTGIQRLLRMASLDPDFRKDLVARRGAIAAAARIELSASETAILDAIPAAQLSGMIDRIPPPSSERREFLRQTAAGAVILLGGVAFVEASSTCFCGGAAPDMPPETPRPAEPPPAGGVSEPPPADDPDAVGRPEVNPMQIEGGADPGEPPERDRK